MVESQQLIEATKHSTDGNTAIAGGNYDSAAAAYKQAAEWYGKALELTSDSKSHDALSLLKKTFEFSAEIAQQRKLLSPYMEQLKNIEKERNRKQETSSIHKVESRVNIAA